MKKYVLAYFFSFSLSYLLDAQVWQPVTEVPLEEEIMSISIDNKQQFYVGLASGSLIRYQSTGEEDQYFSTLNNAAITTIEAWNRMKVFAFFRDQQRVEILDRFTTTPRSLEFSTYQIPFVWLITPGMDNSLWILSTGLKELHKYDELNQNLLINIPLKDKLGIEKPVFLRAYKNLILLADEAKGIFIFDQFGSYLGLVDLPGVSYFQLFENQLVTLSNGDLIWIDPFEQKELKRIKAPNDGASKVLVITENQYVFFTKNGFILYSLL